MHKENSLYMQLICINIYPVFVSSGGERQILKRKILKIFNRRQIYSSFLFQKWESHTCIFYIWMKSMKSVFWSRMLKGLIQSVQWSIAFGVFFQFSTCICILSMKSTSVSTNCTEKTKIEMSECRSRCKTEINKCKLKSPFEN